MINVFNPSLSSNFVTKQGDTLMGRLLFNDMPFGEFVGMMPIRQDLEVGYSVTEEHMANPFMRFDWVLPSEGPRKKKPLEVIETAEQKKQREYFETRIRPRLIVKPPNEKLSDLFRRLMYNDMAENLLLRGGLFNHAES